MAAINRSYVRYCMTAVIRSMTAAGMAALSQGCLERVRWCPHCCHQETHLISHYTLPVTQHAAVGTEWCQCSDAQMSI